MTIKIAITINCPVIVSFLNLIKRPLYQSNFIIEQTGEFLIGEQMETCVDITLDIDKILCNYQILVNNCDSSMNP